MQSCSLTVHDSLYGSRRPKETFQDDCIEIAAYVEGSEIIFSCLIDLIIEAIVQTIDILDDSVSKRPPRGPGRPQSVFMFFFQ